MGDRRNIVLEYPEATVGLYTHWRGTEAPADLLRALVRGKGRWNDYPYLARVIFCAMVEDDITGDTGYGIEAMKKGDHTYCEASDRDLYVDLVAMTVRWGEFTWTYEQYVALDDVELRKM